MNTLGCSFALAVAAGLWLLVLSFVARSPMGTFLAGLALLALVFGEGADDGEG